MESLALQIELVLKARRTAAEAERVVGKKLGMSFRSIKFVGLALRLESRKAVMARAIESPTTLIGNEGIWWPTDGAN